jgi:hypothetical protein
VTRQPYAGVFYLCVLITKGFLLLKSKWHGAYQPCEQAFLEVSSYLI